MRETRKSMPSFLVRLAFLEGSDRYKDQQAIVAVVWPGIDGECSEFDVPKLWTVTDIWWM